MKIKKGFTLAEVLITLAIIGVVASMTIPGLINNLDIDRKANEASLRKMITALNDATKMIVMTETRNHSMTGTMSDVRFSYTKYLNVIKTCKSGESYSDCDDSNVATGKSNYTDKNGNEIAFTTDMSTQTGDIFMLADGTFIIVKILGNTCNETVKALYDRDLGPKTVKNACGYVIADVNGVKGPNKPGVDRYVIPIGKQGVKLDGEDIEEETPSTP